jgi:hypothetical protein
VQFTSNFASIPRQYEKAMHMFFRGVRVYKRKEFFAATVEDVHHFFDIVEGKDVEDAEDYRKALWTSLLENCK